MESVLAHTTFVLVSSKSSLVFLDTLGEVVLHTVRHLEGCLDRMLGRHLLVLEFFSFLQRGTEDIRVQAVREQGQSNRSWTNRYCQGCQVQQFDICSAWDDLVRLF